MCGTRANEMVVGCKRFELRSSGCLGASCGLSQKWAVGEHPDPATFALTAYRFIPCKRGEDSLFATDQMWTLV